MVIINTNHRQMSILMERVLNDTSCFLSYQENDSFGFHIRGGEMKKKQTDKFLECYYMSPVFISHIVKDSIADK